MVCPDLAISSIPCAPDNESSRSSLSPSCHPFYYTMQGPDPLDPVACKAWADPETMKQRAQGRKTDANKVGTMGGTRFRLLTI